ncbi:uncharacterized protein [Cicer arietinum]|nr:uncharacterized protein LOC101515417 isoform X2 [Cicer arietinum]
MAVVLKPNTNLPNVEEKMVQSTPHEKQSIKSKIKALLNEDKYKKKGRHKRSSTCPTKSQLTRVNSVHHLEVDPLSEMLLTVENPEPVIETFQNHLAAGTLDVLSPVFSGRKPISYNDKCVECGEMFSSESLEDEKIHKHHSSWTDTKNLSSSSESLPEEKLMNAKIFTTDASPHLFKDFLDALDVINTNKDFLLKYINDPGSPLPFQIHNQQHSLNSKSRRANSISLPVCGSSSGTKDSEIGQEINQMVDDFFITKGEIQSQTPNVSMFEPLGDFYKPSTSSLHKVDQELVERDRNISSESSQVANSVKTKNFKDLRKKIKHIIEESKNEKRRISMDGIIDKIPRGNKFAKNVRKLIHEQSKVPNGEGKDSGSTSGYRNRLSSYWNNKRQLSSMRTSSLKESVNRYSQLYETCCHNEVSNEVKHPKTESLRLKTDDRCSIIKTPKSIKRFLSLPNIKSHFNQIEEPSVLLSPQNSIRKPEDRTINKSITDQKILSPTLSDHENEESILNDDQKEALVRSVSESESDVNDEIKTENSIGFDDLENLRDNECGAYNEQDIGYTTESSTLLVEANSAFSSDTSFLDCTFELENLNVLEESDQELKLDPSYYEFNTMIEKQEPKLDHSEIIDIGESFLKFGYEIPCMEVHESNEAAFNYVKKVLELSGFTSHESFGLWYSDKQPLDPSVYEELEGCLLLDPDCSGNCDEGGHCNHLLLFDIVNEGLLEIFGRSYSYYPRPLSSLSYVHPLPSGGDNVLQKVWKLISWYLNSTSEPYPSLDYYVSKDLAKNDGWMNLQFDSECVGLELDDLILDDLLEEIIYS